MADMVGAGADASPVPSPQIHRSYSLLLRTSSDWELALFRARGTILLLRVRQPCLTLS